MSKIDKQNCTYLAEDKARGIMPTVHVDQTTYEDGNDRLHAIYHNEACVNETSSKC